MHVTYVKFPFSKVNDEQCVGDTISELCSLLGEFNCLSPCLMYHNNCSTNHHKRQLLNERVWLGDPSELWLYACSLCCPRTIPFFFFESWKDMCSTDPSLIAYPCMHAVFSSSSHCVFSGLQTPTEWYFSKSPGLQDTSERSKVYSMAHTSTCLSEDFRPTRDQSYRMPCSWSSLLDLPITFVQVLDETRTWAEAELQSESCIVHMRYDTTCTWNSRGAHMYVCTHDNDTM